MSMGQTIGTTMLNPCRSDPRFNPGPYGFLELDAGFWLVPYDTILGTPPTACGPGDYCGQLAANPDPAGPEPWPQCHDIHCVVCGCGTDPGPLDGTELREAFAPGPYVVDDDSAVEMGNGYELCRACFETLAGVL
jgi:hypothetical protein